jgi:hypothetical protein
MRAAAGVPALEATMSDQLLVLWVITIIGIVANAVYTSRVAWELARLRETVENLGGGLERLPSCAGRLAERLDDIAEALRGSRGVP